jgi:uncharacterized protein
MSGDGAPSEDRSSVTGQRVEMLPIFPLPSVVLFPFVRVPLFIFEPRYREMVKIAIERDGLIGMVTVVPDEVPMMAGDPGVFQIGCIGRIESPEQRPDGNYDLVLEGLTRFRIEKERERQTEQRFRTADVVLLQDPDIDLKPAPNNDPAVRAIEECRAQVHAQYTKLLELEAPEFLERFRTGQLDAIPNSVYVNSIAAALNISTLEKQSLLDCPSTLARFERLLAVLAFKLAEPRLRTISHPTSLQ